MVPILKGFLLHFQGGGWTCCGGGAGTYQEARGNFKPSRTLTRNAAYDFSKTVRRELRGRLGLWAAVFQSRQSSSCGARMLARHSWVNQGDKSLRLLGGSHGKCHRKTRHPPGVSVRKHRQAQSGKQPALPVHVPGDSTWPQQRWLWWEPAPTAGAW